MFATINEGVFALRSNMLTELKPETEIILEGIVSKGNSIVLDSVVDAWLIKETKSPKVLLLQGIAGSGKTQFCQKLTLRLWEQYRDNDNPIPLYITLPNLKNPTARAIEETLENVGFNQGQVAILKERYNFVVILDGYDELYEFTNLHLSNRLSEWRAQTIITCRSEVLYFISDYEKYFVPFNKANRRFTIGLQQIDIKPLPVLQIEKFLTAHLKDNLNGITYAEITTIPGLLSLIQTPLLLKAILPVKKYSLISPKDFYDAFIEARFLWQEQKLKLNKLIDKTIDFKPYFWSYCKILALTMQEQETNIMSYRQTNISLFESSFEVNIWEKFFKGERKIKWIYSACPLIKIDSSSIEFLDNCLIDYFAIQIKFYEELELFPKYKLVTMQVQKEEQEIETLQLPVIGRKLFTEQSGKIQQLADRVIERESFKVSLFNYIELSKTDKRYAVAAANAISGLNAARVSFSGRNLRGVKIREANLIRGIFGYTDFEGADLSGVRLKEAWLQGANLKGSDLSDALFGELAYKQLDSSIKACAYSKDGHYFAVAAGNDITIYKTEKAGKLILYRTITGHTNLVNSVTFSPDNEWLSSGSHDNTVRLWSLTDPNKTQTLTGHTHHVTSVTFSSDNQWLASGSGDNTVRIWSLKDPNHWNLKDPNNTQTPTPTDHILYINSVAFSHDNQWLALGSINKAVRLWRLTDSNNNNIQILTGGHTMSINSVSFSPDNLWLASGSEDGTVCLWSLKDPNNIPKPKTLTGHTNCVCSVTFSPDNKWLASGSRDNTICLWSLTDPNNNTTLNGHTGYVNSVSFSPDNQWLASGGEDNIVRFWSLTDLNSITQTITGHTHSVHSVTFSPDNKWLASGSRDNTVRLWSLTDPNNNQTLTGHTDSVSSVTFSPDNLWLVSGSIDCTIRLCSLIDPKNTQILTGHTDRVSSVTISPDNKWLASGSHDNTVRLWSLTDPKNNQTLTGHTSWVNSISFSTDNKWLASGGQDNTVRLWSLIDPSNNQTIIGHIHGINSVSFSPDNKWLASGGEDNSVRLWSLNDSNNNQTLIGHTKIVESVTFSPDNKWLASGGWDKKIVIWSFFNTYEQGIRVELAFSVIINFIIFSLNYHQIDSDLYLATGGQDHSVSLWQQTPSNQLLLLWNSHQNKLYLNQADITDAIVHPHISELLFQRGATDKTKMDVSTYAEENSPRPSINQTRLLEID